MTLSYQHDHNLKDIRFIPNVGGAVRREMSAFMFCFHLGNQSEIKYVYIIWLWDPTAGHTSQKSFSHRSPRITNEDVSCRIFCDSEDLEVAWVYINWEGYK